MNRLLLILLAATSAFAQESEVLTLRRAVAAALENAPAIDAAVAAAEAARAATAEAEAALDPHLTLAASAFRHDEPMIVSPIHGFDPGEIPAFDRTLIQSSATGTLLLWDGGASRRRVAQARALGEAVEIGADEVRERITVATVAAYLEVLAIERELSAEMERVEAVEAERARVARLREVGRAAAVEEFRVEAALEAARARRIDADARRSVALASLARLTGMQPENLIDVSVTRTEPNVHELEAAAVSSSARIRRLQSEVAAREAGARAAEGSRKPQLSAAGNLLEFGSGQGDFTFEWNVGLQLRFNAIDGGAAAARVARARAEARQAAAELEAARLEQMDQLETALAAGRRATALVDSYEAAIRSLAEVARVERLRLENGVGVQAEYLRAEAELAAARAALAGAERSLGLAQTELARVAGELDLPWIEANFRSGE